MKNLSLRNSSFRYSSLRRMKQKNDNTHGCCHSSASFFSSNHQHPCPTHCFVFLKQPSTPTLRRLKFGVFEKIEGNDSLGFWEEWRQWLGWRTKVVVLCVSEKNECRSWVRVSCRWENLLGLILLVWGTQVSKTQVSCGFFLPCQLRTRVFKTRVSSLNLSL